MEKVRFDTWESATAKIREKLGAARVDGAEAEGGTEAEAEGGTEGVRYVTTSGAAVAAAGGTMEGELVYAPQGGAAVPGSGGGGGGGSKGKGKGKAKAKAEARLVVLELQEVRGQLAQVAARKAELEAALGAARTAAEEQDGAAREQRAQQALAEERAAQQQAGRDAAERELDRLRVRVAALEETELKLAVESREASLLRGQLEAAAQLAEQQNALCASLEGRLGALECERGAAAEHGARALEALAEGRYLADAALRQVVDSHAFVRDIQRELDATFGTFGTVGTAEGAEGAEGAGAAVVLKRAIHRLAQLLGAVSAAGSADHASLNATLLGLEALRAETRGEEPREMGPSACAEGLVAELRDAVQLAGGQERQAREDAGEARALVEQRARETDALQAQLAQAVGERQTAVEQLAATEAELGALRSTSAGNRAVAEQREREHERLREAGGEQEREVARLRSELAAEQEQGKKRRGDLAELMKKTVTLEGELSRYKQEASMLRDTSEALYSLRVTGGVSGVGAGLSAGAAGASSNNVGLNACASAVVQEAAAAVQPPPRTGGGADAVCASFASTVALPAAGTSAEAQDLQ
eukprot:g8063.t1